MTDNRLNRYARLWTTDRDRVALFTVNGTSNQSYLLYTYATQHIRLIADSELGRQLVQKMLENGVRFLQDKYEQHAFG